MYLAEFLGALFITYFISRLFRLVFKAKHEPTRSVLAVGATLFLAVLLGGYGFADGGPPQFGHAIALYTPAVLLWLLRDYVRAKKAAGDESQT